MQWVQNKQCTFFSETRLISNSAWQQKTSTHWFRLNSVKLVFSQSNQSKLNLWSLPNPHSSSRRLSVMASEKGHPGSRWFAPHSTWLTEHSISPRWHLLSASVHLGALLAQWGPLVINAKPLYNSCFGGHIHPTLGHTGKVPPTPHTTYEHKDILCKTHLLATLRCLPLMCCSLGKDHSIPWQPGREQSTGPHPALGPRLLLRQVSERTQGPLPETHQCPMPLLSNSFHSSRNLYKV